jgi:hypothetical protein
MPWDRSNSRFELAVALGLALAATAGVPAIALTQSDQGTSVAVDPEIPHYLPSS